MKALPLLFLLLAAPVFASERLVSDERTLDLDTLTVRVPPSGDTVLVDHTTGVATTLNPTAFLVRTFEATVALPDGRVLHCPYRLRDAQLDVDRHTTTDPTGKLLVLTRLLQVAVRCSTAQGDAHHATVATGTLFTGHTVYTWIPKE